MVKLNSNTVAVDEIKDVYKAEKLLKKIKYKWKKFLDPNIKNKSKTVEDKIQLYTHQGMELPLPTEIEISEFGNM